MNPFRRVRVFLAVFVLCCVTSVSGLWAQDSHYWTSQFGNRARLLSGAVFGSTDDLSAVYYNPGSLALVERSSILLSGNVFEATNVKVKNTTADQEASFWDTRLSPSLFAGEVGAKEKGQNRIAYSFLTRYSSKLRLDSLATIAGGDFAPELEFIGSDFRIFNVAVGVEHDLNARLHGYAGFRTDFSGLGRESSGNDAVTLLDIYHLSGGATIRIRDNEFTVGGVLSFGSAPIARELVIPGVLDLTNEATVSYFRFLAILGFSFDF